MDPPATGGISFLWHHGMQHLVVEHVFQKPLRHERLGEQRMEPNHPVLFLECPEDEIFLRPLLPPPAERKGVRGVAVAKQTYRSDRETRASKRWAKHAAEGARRQRLLGASTRTKDAAKPDTYYIEALVAPQTINTIPPATIEAFVDHGKLGEFLPVDGGDADQVIAKVTAAGIDVPALAAKLQSDGAASFVRAWEDLMRSIKSKTAALAGTAP